MAPPRASRLAHSLKRDIGTAAVHRRADSPMSMTSPSQAHTRASPSLPDWPSAAPPSTLPQRRLTSASSARYAAASRLLCSHLDTHSDVAVVLRHLDADAVS